MLIGLKKYSKNNNRAQSLLEYLTVAGLVITILIAMNQFIKRGIQGMVRTVADQIGNQEGAEQDFEGSGYLEKMDTITRVNVNDQTKSGRLSAGPLVRPLIPYFNYIYDQTTMTGSNQLLNFGFQEQPQ